METTTDTFDLLVVRSGEDPQELAVEPGTTVSQIAETLGLEGAGQMSALDGEQNALGPNDVINENTQVLSFVYKLAGA